MKILILNWRDIKHPLAGGAEISLFEHAKFWKKKGADVTWFAAGFPGATAEEEIDGIRILRKGTHFTVHLHAFLFFRNKEHIYDVIIDSFHFVPFFTPFYLSNLPIIALINEPAKNAWFKNIFFPLSLIGFLVEPLFFRVYQSRPFFTAANSIALELCGLGIVKNNITIIPHGITQKSFIYKEKRYKRFPILYLSQLSEDKGIEDALKAFHILASKRNDIELWIVGRSKSKAYQQKIEKYIQSLQLKGKVTLFGYISEKEKEKVLREAFVLIHPSIREGWGLNVIEANMFGVPAIGYNVTGLRDSIIDGKTGLLTKSNTPTSLAASIQETLDNPKLYGSLSKNACEWAKSFSWDAAGKKSWDLISYYAKK